jgi:ABC-type antimicrobial peptide transport system permease subunit
MTQKEQFDQSYDQQRMVAALSGFFGVLAALLVATGLYGTHSLRVSQRRTEIGVRIALGASKKQILSLVMRESLWILLGGLAAGLPLTLLVMRPLSSMLYQLSPFDSTSFTVALAAIVLVSGLAAAIPARRAASMDPMRSLRTE